jgi:RNA polymerase sigma-70 factor (ECF subfamily)
VDREEFTTFYAASFPRLVGQLYAMTGDQGEAQDAVQEAFVRAWVHRARIDTDRGAEAWVRVTAWRIAASRWRRAREGVRLMLLAARPIASPGQDLTGWPSSRRCETCPGSSAARWCSTTWWI